MNGTKIVGGGSAGGALAAAIVYLLSRFNVNLTGEDGALIATSLVAAGAFVVHNGIRGCARILWRGAGNDPEPPAPSA